MGMENLANDLDTKSQQKEYANKICENGENCELRELKENLL